MGYNYRNDMAPKSDAGPYWTLRDLVRDIKSGDTDAALMSLYQYVPDSAQRELVEQFKRGDI